MLELNVSSEEYRRVLSYMGYCFEQRIPTHGIEYNHPITNFHAGAPEFVSKVLALIRTHIL